MPDSRTTIHRTRIRRGRVVAFLAGIAVAAALSEQVLATSSSTAPSPGRVPAGEHRPPRGEHRSTPGEAGGAVPDDTTVFDDEVAGVANLDPALLDALRRAATDAADEGVTLLIDS